ncbi:MAG: hypothetical protein DI551_11465 [Micavibrio aeruginosavorus]|uniref:Uncharacterized protein n=1 Tax=Micavibrio aeruginosavorus TaxID=349221 RepID=A0A2W5MTU0_9BACT|nr:MAG: hypothetical protein DI551_11465 [Micavibrio aeruginosavorus]
MKQRSKLSCAWVCEGHVSNPFDPESNVPAVVYRLQVTERGQPSARLVALPNVSAYDLKTLLNMKAGKEPKPEFLTAELIDKGIDYARRDKNGMLRIDAI